MPRTNTSKLAQHQRKRPREPSARDCLGRDVEGLERLRYRGSARLALQVHGGVQGETSEGQNPPAGDYGDSEGNPSRPGLAQQDAECDRNPPEEGTGVVDMEDI